MLHQLVQRDLISEVALAVNRDTIQPGASVGRWLADEAPGVVTSTGAKNARCDSIALWAAYLCMPTDAEAPSGVSVHMRPAASGRRVHGRECRSRVGCVNCLVETADFERQMTRGSTRRLVKSAVPSGPVVWRGERSVTSVTGIWLRASVRRSRSTDRTRCKAVNDAAVAIALQRFRTSTPRQMVSLLPRSKATTRPRVLSQHNAARAKQFQHIRRLIR